MVRVTIASVIYALIIAIYLSQSGAPLRVHLATAASLAIGFLIPALAIASLAQFMVKWKLVLSASLAGAFFFDLLTSLVVAKSEFLAGWYFKYPLLVVCFGALLFIHSAASGFVARQVAAS